MDVTDFAHVGTVVSVACNGEETEFVRVTLEGIQGDVHACRSYIPHHGERWQAWWDNCLKDTLFFNWRSWIAISAEERSRLAESLEMPEIKPGGLGENFVFSGIPAFSKLPPGAHLCIYDNNDRPVCILLVQDQNFPCTKTAKHLYDTHGCTMEKSAFGRAFKKQAENLRGTMGLVLYPGGRTAIVRPGDTVKVWLPVNAHHIYRTEPIG